MEPTIWGGEDGCAHEWGDEAFRPTSPISDKTGLHNDGRAVQVTEKYRETLDAMTPPASQGQFCARCNAWRGALGLEPTPALFVEHIVKVFREVRRVLRPDGALWLNLGDSYATKPGNNDYHGKSPDTSGLSNPERQAAVRNTATRHIPIPDGLKPKDLVGIPWMVAFALRADGWWLRQDIIWAKPNPMPESVTDRCTKAHEYLFLLSKSGRYYYDADAIREPNTEKSLLRHAGDPEPRTNHRYLTESTPQRPHEGRLDTNGGWTDGRNKRSVWTIPTASFPEAHFATFPPALVEPCILAGSREGDVVLDPFLGSGTTALVAKRLGRQAVGIDLNAEYLKMAVRRCAQLGLFA